MKKLMICILGLLLLTIPAIAESSGLEMADRLRQDGRIYAVVAVMTIIFTGIAIFLLYIDTRVRKLEKEKKN